MSCLWSSSTLFIAYVSCYIASTQNIYQYDILPHYMVWSVVGHVFLTQKHNKIFLAGIIYIILTNMSVVATSDTVKYLLTLS